MKRDSKEFFNLSSRFIGARPATARTWWESFYEVIVRELYTSGMVYLPKIGYFTLKHIDEQVQKQKNPEGGFKYYVVPERDKPVFTPDDDFINDVNMTGVTKSYRRRLNYDGLTLRDKEREKRAKQILGLEPEEINTEEAKTKCRATFNFEDKLQELKDKYKDKYEDSDT